MGTHFAASELAIDYSNHSTHEFVTRLMNSTLQERHVDPNWHYDGHRITDKTVLEVKFISSPKRRTTWPRDYWFRPRYTQQYPIQIRTTVHADLAGLARRYGASINDIHSFMRFPPVRAVVRTLLIELERPEAQSGQQPNDTMIVDRVNEAILSTSRSERHILLTQMTQTGLSDFADRALTMCLIKLYVHYETWNRWEFGHGDQRPVVTILTSIVGLFCNAWVNAPEISLTWGHLTRTLLPTFPYSDVVARDGNLTRTCLTPEIWLEWSLMYDPWIRRTDSIQLLSPQDVEAATPCPKPPVYIAAVSEPEADREGRVVVKYQSKPDEERWSFKAILDSKWAGKSPRTGLQYLVGWEYAEPTWQPARDLQGCEPWVLEFHRSNPHKAGPMPKLKRLL
ncbi:hypothetical protein CkaCkLH20_10266 [Colletotrichum karsti]|uniref:Chromo domain-containing protein n=1 Tax=Colletotrichum karsti TaxID=1095194 RepID=A0A9P6LDQ3_9PEZI|nr:uncharacterized protein CkaCkLH20_10266 [Colletotrichum karsti]KAF9872174.1 hypothetical protein CkaCkLH20_10266 [Colletotrichum karsti]